MYLVSQVVRLEGLNLTISLKSGEEIHTENSHKYSVEEIQFLANKAGLELKQQWFDRKRQFSLNQLHPPRV
ncbi:MAG: hypothetical protein CME25_23460 [Gemmatimonadetes bacterium]|nr:hypothetical protein [Gemmatimonadota bacterium]